ncbi:MAG: hypothetical protein ACFE9N_16615, partial [Promethearchaeota archaeon]
MNSNNNIRIFQYLKFILLIFGIFLIGSNISVFYFDLIVENNKYRTSFESLRTNQEGEKLNVSLHQSYLNPSPIGFTNLSNLNTFSIPCPTEPTFNASYTEFQIENIYAPNKSWVVEEDHQFTVLNCTASNYFYVGFYPKGVG